MKVEIHTLAWPNTDVRMLQSHSDVCLHLGIPVAYTLEKVPHGQWMDSIMALRLPVRVSMARREEYCVWD